jgi:NAD-dependent DNA ligase
VTAIVPPSECPSCNGVLVFINDILYCKNKSCSEQQQKKLENFAQKVKIKGLGPSTLEKLSITQIDELYHLEQEDINTAIGDKLGSKLFKEIIKSHEAPANLLLPAFSIPLVGNTATKKLANVCDTIWDISMDTCTEAGLGPKTARHMVDWIEDNVDLLSRLPHSMTFEKINRTSNQAVVCITGKLYTYKSKSVAAKILQDFGYEVKSTVTKDVTILVNESGIESAKVKKAKASGVTIITNLSELIGDQQNGYTS